MNIFTRAVSAASARLLDVMGENAVLVPRLRAQYSGKGADPERTEIEITGVFSGEPKHEDLSGQRRGEFVATSRAASMSSEFWLSADDVAALPWRPRKGDAIKLTDRPDEPVYAINWAAPEDGGDLTLHISIEGAGE